MEPGRSRHHDLTPQSPPAHSPRSDAPGDPDTLVPVSVRGTSTQLADHHVLAALPSDFPMTPGALETDSATDLDLVRRVCDRAFVQMVAMIHIANHGREKQSGDPKVGGHPAACASAAHLLGALHLVVRRPQDYVACKPHASPIDHAYHHLMRLFRRIRCCLLYTSDAADE